ncbi:hypothetical protein [Tabrizicola sp.]|uniref:hypothetical protein n=1 Tax=Tabrizicola sp. TaxID=2005166 RepID=UPI0026312E66|nr:hypothetical protein [Tabrizicola sp.]MDM7933289.1 hypothetical protein [Tabrizicola sp.]
MKPQSMSCAQSLSRALAATTFAALCLPAFAEDQSYSNSGSPAGNAAPGGAATIVLARDLHTLGIREGDALTVLAAARLAASVEVVVQEPAALDPATLTLDGLGQGFLAGSKLPVPTDPKAPPPLATGAPRPAAKVMLFGESSKDDGSPPASVEAMFGTASNLAGDDEILLGLIEEAMAEGPGARIGTAASWLSRLPAGGTDLWEIPFQGSLDAEIAVIGGGDETLDLAVSDANGTLVCLDIGRSDRFHCHWTPVRDGHFYVTVRNAGRESTSYQLLTN